METNVVRLDHDIVVAEHDQVPSGELRTAVPGRGRATSLLDRKLDPDLAAEALTDQVFDRLVSTGVIDDHDLQAIERVLKTQHGVECCGKGVRAAGGRNDHADGVGTHICNPWAPPAARAPDIRLGSSTWKWFLAINEGGSGSLTTLSSFR